MKSTVKFSQCFHMHSLCSGLPRGGMDPGEKNFRTPNKGKLTKNLYMKSDSQL